MPQPETLQIADAQDVEFSPAGESVGVNASAIGDVGGVETHGAVDWQAYPQYDGYADIRRFVSQVLVEVGRDYDAGDCELVDEIDDPQDVFFGVLAQGPDGTLVFVGSDPTAKDSIPWFAYAVGPAEPVPAPESAREALDRLKPPAVRDVEYESDWLPGRHGEWWLLPTPQMPAGTVFNPGVASQPYGPSPLGNHVPREYAFTVPDAAFMDAFREGAKNAPASIDSPPEAIAWTYRQLQKDPVPDHAPNWADIRAWGGEVLIRGTLRHRDDDHFVEDCGDTWHRALTHDVEVYTGDGIAEDVHLDYHGR